MSARERSGNGERPSKEFLDALGDVKPLGARKKTVVGARPPTRSARGARADPTPIAFEHPDPHEPRLGHVAGVDRRSLARLRSGRSTPEHTLDLHGMTESEAREAVRATLRTCAARGLRRVLVVHGRGLHSQGEPVLRAALPGWLAEAGIAEGVLAFAPAASFDGGAGATAILLRRRERRRGGGSPAR